MKLQEIFDQLSAGELIQMSIGGQEAGVLSPENYHLIIPHINLGLAALYKRFNLKQGRLTVLLQPGLQNYVLDARAAVSYTKPSTYPKYILDSAGAPFKDDILKIEQVLTSEGIEYGLNDAGNIWSMLTPTSNTIRIPEELVDGSFGLGNFPDSLRSSTLHVVYRANHFKIVIPLGYFDPTRVDMELPYSHLEPLLWFIASRVNNPVGMTNEFHAGNAYYQKYELACQQLEVSNLQIDSVGYNNRLRRNGFA